jgi:hypothetical protein
MKNIKYFDISHNHIYDQNNIIYNINNIQTLYYFDISYNNITTGFYNGNTLFHSLSSLIYFNIAYNPVNGLYYPEGIYPTFLNTHALQYINLCGTNLSPQMNNQVIPMNWNNLTSLTYLYIDNTPTAKGIDMIQFNLLSTLSSISASNIGLTCSADGINSEFCLVILHKLGK